MTTNLARATKVIDRTAEKVGTRAPLLAQALKRARLLVPDAPNPVEHGMTIDGGGTRADCVSVSLLCDFGGPLRRRRHARCLRPALGRWGRRTGRLAHGRRNLPHRKGILTMHRTATTHPRPCRLPRRRIDVVGPIHAATRAEADGCRARAAREAS